MKKRKTPRVSRRNFLKLIGSISGLSLLAGIGAWKYITQTEPSQLEVVELSLALPRLDEAFSGLKLLQISDIHAGEWMPIERFANVVDEILLQKPDIIVITGDFSSGYTWDSESPEDLNDLAEELCRLSDAHLTLAVLGNHDYWTGVDIVRDMLEQANITELSNDIFSLARDNAQFHLCGLDDAYECQDDINQVLDKIPEDGAAILLAHEPDTADRNAATGRFDLQLSGHSHGGQVAILGLEQFWHPFLGRKYPSGLYQIENMWQYTNRGLGMAYFPVRFNCRPEVTVFTLSAI